MFDTPVRIAPFSGTGADLERIFAGSAIAG
jgi:hypothetical protein